MNWKKELGLSLQDLKSQQWFKDADKEIQDMAIESQRACMTPPSVMENTLMNIYFNAYGLEDEWAVECKKKYPWAEPIIGNAEINLRKRAFLTKHYISMEKCNAG